MQANDDLAAPPAPEPGMADSELIRILRERMATRGITFNDLGVELKKKPEHVEGIFDGLVRPTLSDLWGLHEVFGTALSVLKFVLWGGDSWTR